MTYDITFDWTEPDDQPEPGGDFRIIGTLTFTVPANHGCHNCLRWAAIDALLGDESPDGSGPIAIQEQVADPRTDLSEPQTYTYNIITNNPAAITPRAVETRLTRVTKRYLDALNELPEQDP